MCKKGVTTDLNAISNPTLQLLCVWSDVKLPMQKANYIYYRAAASRDNEKFCPASKLKLIMLASSAAWLQLTELPWVISIKKTSLNSVAEHPLS